MKHASDRQLPGLPPADLYRAVPVCNHAATTRQIEDGLLLEIPRRKAGGFWAQFIRLAPLSPSRRIYLDALGSALFRECDGTRCVGAIIRAFAQAHGLSFLEARALVLNFLGNLMRRGAIAVVLNPVNGTART